MKPNDSVVESLLRQMELTSPSIRLDQAIGELSRGDLNKLPQRSSEVFSQRRFGWKALVSTAVAACVFGLFLGQFVSIYPGQRSAVANADFSDPDLDRSRNILPVRFSVDAFEMMHGHSRQAEFANCAACHIAGREQDEAFEGWYYGNEDFFESHDFKGVANCSACHVFLDADVHAPGQTAPMGFELPDLHGFSPDFINGECSDCHTGSTG